MITMLSKSNKWMINIIYHNGETALIGPFNSIEERMQWVDEYSKHFMSDISTLTYTQIYEPITPAKADVKVVKAPEKYEIYQPYDEIVVRYNHTNRIFLAGSIDMGAAEMWQDAFVDKLSYGVQEPEKVVIFNPRRDDWDSSWIQSKTDPKFSEQVRWETHYLKEASIRVFFFGKDSKSPITLLELGRFATDQKYIKPKSIPCFVCCEPGYWRRGNVEMLCQELGIALCDTLDELTNMVLNHLNVKNKIIIK